MSDLPQFEIPPRILIVEAPYYAHIAENLLKGAQAVLHEVGARVEIISVPGALEIPTSIALAAKNYDGFVALGCVIRGETTHYESVANESARGLIDLGLRERVCIGNGILTVENEVQAIVRAMPEKLDKGGFAARACLSLIALKRKYAS
ncbi:MAG: 6,7-dimethyl-8-ribityllumazine synthase [Pseudomonadota bacterium]